LQNKGREFAVMNGVRVSRKNQSGVAAIIVGLSLVVLLAFAGLVIDTGRLFVTKAELQTAVDACALAGAPYVGDADKAQLALAQSIASEVGNKNFAVFQKNRVEIPLGNVSFSDTIDGIYKNAPADDVDARRMTFIRCEAVESGILNSFMQVLGVQFAKSTVVAVAKASMVSGGTNCLLPVALCTASKGAGGSFEVGKWYEGRVSAQGNNQTSIDGSFRWVQLPGEGNGAGKFRDRLMAETCTQIQKNAVVSSSPGQMSNLDKAYNTKFGVYQNPLLLSDGIPDKVGFSYFEPSFASGATTTAYSQYKIDITKMESARDFQEPSQIAFNPKPISQEDFSLDDLNRGGLKRRLLSMPVVECDALGNNGSAVVTEIACMLALHPIGQQGSVVNTSIPSQIVNGNCTCSALDSAGNCVGGVTCSASSPTDTGNCRCPDNKINPQGACTGNALVCANPPGTKDITNLMRLEYVDAGGSGSACASLGAPGVGGVKVPGLVQ